MRKDDYHEEELLAGLAAIPQWTCLHIHGNFAGLSFDSRRQRGQGPLCHGSPIQRLYHGRWHTSSPCLAQELDFCYD